MKLSKGRGKKGKANCLTLKGDTRDVVGAAVAMGERLEAMEGPEAKKRQGRPGKKRTERSGNLPEHTGDTRADALTRIAVLKRDKPPGWQRTAKALCNRLADLAGLDDWKPEADHPDREEVAP